MNSTCRVQPSPLRHENSNFFFFFFVLNDYFAWANSEQTLSIALAAPAPRAPVPWVWVRSALAPRAPSAPLGLWPCLWGAAEGAECGNTTGIPHFIFFLAAFYYISECRDVSRGRLGMWPPQCKTCSVFTIRLHIPIKNSVMDFQVTALSHQRGVSRAPQCPQSWPRTSLCQLEGWTLCCVLVAVLDFAISKKTTTHPHYFLCICRLISSCAR